MTQRKFTSKLKNQRKLCKQMGWSHYYKPAPINFELSLNHNPS